MSANFSDLVSNFILFVWLLFFVIRAFGLFNYTRMRCLSMGHFFMMWNFLGKDFDARVWRLHKSAGICFLGFKSTVIVRFILWKI